MFDPANLSQPAIAFDVTPLQNAHRFRGIGTYVRGLAARLADQKAVPLEFWGWQGDAAFDVAPPHTFLGVSRLPTPEYRAAWAFAQLDMRRRSARSNVRAIHVTDPSALRAIPGRKMMTTAYDLIPLKHGIGRRSVLNRLGYSAYLKALRSTAVVFAISDATAQDLNQILDIPRERIVLAIPGIDLGPAAAEHVKRERPYFLFIGGPNPNKNLNVVLDALALSPAVHEELVIVGRWLPKQVHALEQDMSARGLAGRVRHLGYVPEDELVSLIAAATALVVPSLEEGFGLPVGEGLAAGALVIHSRLPILEEVSGGLALMFDPHSPRELAACLERAASGGLEIEDLRRRGHEHARNLTWDAAVDVTLSTYESILQR